MLLTEQLIRIADCYCAATRLSRSRVSTLVFGDGKRLDGVVIGKDINTRSFERAMAWFSTNWPATAVWPDAIRRPEVVVS